MEQIVCRKCGSIDFYTELKSNQNVARCSKCDSFIKNIPYKEPKLYVGKYKDMPISEIQDSSYLEWAIKTLRLGSYVRDAVQKQIDKLNFIAK